MIRGMTLARKAWSAAPRILAGASALVLTVAAVFYTPIVLGLGQQGYGMGIRTNGLLVASMAERCARFGRPDG
jgi:hypothetical protein